MKKFLALLLCICMLIPMLIACNGTSDTPESTTTAAGNVEEDASSELVLVADGKTDYVIVRPEKGQS